MHEHFYNVAYVVNENGLLRNYSCLLRSAKVPPLDAARAHIRAYFLKNPAAIITIKEVTSVSKEVYIRLGGDPNAPLVNVENW